MDTGEKLFIGIFVCFIILGFLKKEKQDIPYHSSVYSSWQEEEIDELRCELADMEDKYKNRD